MVKKKSSKEETSNTQSAAKPVDSASDTKVSATGNSPKAPVKTETVKPENNKGAKSEPPKTTPSESKPAPGPSGAAPEKPKARTANTGTQATAAKKSTKKPVKKTTAAVAQKKTDSETKSATAAKPADQVKSDPVQANQAAGTKTAAVTDKPKQLDSDNAALTKPPTTAVAGKTDSTEPAAKHSLPSSVPVAGKVDQNPKKIIKPDATGESKASVKVESDRSQSKTVTPASGSKKQDYEEPETPLSYFTSVVEEVKSVNPPIEEAQAVSHEHDEGHHGEPAHYEEPIGPQYPSMFIVQISPELAPLAKVGGLADVVTGLSRELELRGNSVEIILPKYDSMRYDHIWGLCKTFDDLWVPWYGGQVHCTVWFGFVHGRKCFFIEPHSQDNFFNRGAIYGFDDDILRFAFFSRAAVEFLLKSGKQPDVIHCHDWQTALVPVYLYEIYQHMGLTHPRVCFTIHNFKHQGVTGDFLLNATGLQRPDYYFHPDRLLDNNTPHAINLMKGGIVYSNFVTTVSPRYAGETKDGGQGFGLEPTLHTHHYKYGGIVNGIDYDSWNPEIDPYIPAHYSADNIDGKYENKRALRSRLLLADSEKPIIAFVGRLDPQKGLDLVRHALFYSLNNAAQFILLGSSPESEINSYFWELKRHLNDSPDCHIEVGFDEELARLIYAGSDMMVVPSLFEPCGLTQLISMQYGTIPVVRAVGGLADTVFDKDHAHHKALHERNGYVFKDYNNAGLESALSRAISCYYEYPHHFRDLIVNAMRYDYSWKHAGQHYLNIYDYIRNK